MVGEAFELLHQEGGQVFNLSIHPWVMGVPHRIKYLDEALRRVERFGNVWQATPGEIAYASAGNATPAHLVCELMSARAGIKLTHVPYKGSGQATTDLLAGTVPMAIPGTQAMLKHIKDGKLRPLATTGTTRSPRLPDVPTLAEAGLPGYSAYVWMGLLAPKGTPPAIVERLSRELKATLATPEVTAFMNEAGIEMVGSTPAEMDAYFREERDRWARIVRETGAKVD